MVKKAKVQVIGTTDFISIPSADIYRLPCKVDTGADTSAIHCERAKIKEIDGVEYLYFKLLDRKHPLYTGNEIVTKEFWEKKVKSSFGDYEYRYQVRLGIELFGRKFKARFNLSNRKSMKFPVLLGKQILKNKFIVDVSKSNLSEGIK